MQRRHVNATERSAQDGNLAPARMARGAGKRQQGALARSIRSDEHPALTRQHAPVDPLQDLHALRRPDADRAELDGGRNDVLRRRIRARQERRTTGFTSDPIPSMRIVTSSPSCRVNSDGGTIPVPVIKNTPAGNSLSRSKYSMRSESDRCSCDVDVLSWKSCEPSRRIVS